MVLNALSIDSALLLRHVGDGFPIPVQAAIVLFLPHPLDSKFYK